MTSHRVRQHLLALTLPAGCVLTPMMASAQATWNGTTNATWSVGTNWSTTPNVPTDPFDLTIAATTTTNSLTADANHTVGSINYGTRISAFTLQTNANTLTINNGFSATGAFAAVGPTFRGNFILSGAQTFTVAGAAGDVTTDRGLLIRGNNETAAPTPSGTFVLNGNLTKAGAGQLCFINTGISGSGNIIANAGSLKLNAGGNLPLVIGGTGNITVNGTTALLISQNSGSFNLTRPIIVNDTVPISFGGNTENGTVASSFSFNGSAHAVSAGRAFTLTGALSSPAATNVTKTGGSALTFSGDTSGFLGTLIYNAGNLSIANAFGGSLQVGGGTVTASGAVAKNATVSSGALTIAGLVSGNATASGGTLTLNGALTGNASVSGGTANLNGPVGGTVTITGGTTVAAAAITGNISNATGTLTANALAGGDATITSGTLNLNAGLNGSVFGTGGTLNLTGPIGVNLTTTGMTLNSESTAAGNVNLNNNTTLVVQPLTAANLHANQDLSLAGTTTVSILGGLVSGTPFKVASYDGVLTGDETNFALAGGSGLYRGFTFTNNTAAKSIDLSVTAGSVTWTGAMTGTWDVNTTANWTGTSDKFFQFDAVTFPNVATTKLVSMNATVSPSSITFENELGNDYSISGTGTGFISGSASITKNNGGVTQLGGANGQNFTGAITVNGGILRMNSRDAFGWTSGVTVASGAQVDIFGQTPGTVATGGYTYTIAGTGPSPANVGALVNTGAASQSNAGVKSLVLSADATIGGTGRLDIGSANVAGFGTITGNGHTLTITNTDGVGFRGDASATPINIVANAGSIWAENTDNGLGGATGTVTVNTGAKAGTYGVRSIVTPVTLNTGGTLHNQGGGTGTWTGIITLAGTGTAIEANGQNVVISGTLTESGGARTLNKTGTSTLILTSTSGHTGPTTLTNGFLQLGDGGTSGLINSNPVDIASATSGLIYNRSDDVTLSNVLTGSGPAINGSNPAALTKNGTGTLTLTGASTYTGCTRLATGTIAIGSNETVLGTGLLDLRGGAIRSSDASARTVANAISFSANTVFGSATTGNLLFSGASNMGGGAKTFTVDNAITEFSGILSGAASTSALTKAGPGTLIFSNDNTYLQTMTISAGIMQVGNGGTTGNLSTTAVTNNASLVINRSDTTPVFTFANAISGTGTLTHSGTGTTLLSGANTYTGDTIITNGTLQHSLANFTDTASIQISGTGKLDLTHVGTDTVLQLVLNGTPQAVGIYGATGSGAQFETPFITGTGTLTVTSAGGTPYSTWATDKGLNGGNNAPTADPDLDGQPNLDEFAFDGEPLSGKTGGKIVVKVASVGGQQVLTLTLPVRTAVGAFSGTTSLSATGDGVTYQIEGSDALGLGLWNLDIDEVTGPDAAAIQTGLPTLSGAGWIYRTFRSPGTVTGDPTDFLRAKAN